MTVRSDGDGVTNEDEITDGTDPSDKESVDSDHDGLTDKEEKTVGTDPDKEDTDNDGESDAEEIGDVNSPTDTDGDGIIDANESDEADDDSDGVSNEEDSKNNDSTNDTDNDGTNDALESDNSDGKSEESSGESSSGGSSSSSSSGGGFRLPSPGEAEANTDNFETYENQALEISVSDLLKNDEKVESFKRVEDPGKGEVELDGDTITYTPQDSHIGRDYFYYVVVDDEDYEDRGLVLVDVKEGKIVTIDDEETPLFGGDQDFSEAEENQLLVINDETVPLALIEFNAPYINGYPDGSFGKKKPITRAEMATIFARILKLDLSEPGEEIYDDVTNDIWYYKYVQAVSNEGIFSGYPDGSFRPNQPITHAEMATVFSKYWAKKNVVISAKTAGYNDIDGHWAEVHINRFFNAGVAVGYKDGTFRPDTLTNRTELVIMVNRVINRPDLDKEEAKFIDVSSEYWGYGAIEAASEGYDLLNEN